MKVSFELRKEKINSNGLIPIQFIVRAEGERIRKNIGVSVNEKYWDGYRVKPNAKNDVSNNYQFINDKLQKAEEKINDIFFKNRVNFPIIKSGKIEFLLGKQVQFFMKNFLVKHRFLRAFGDNNDVSPLAVVRIFPQSAVGKHFVFRKKKSEIGQQYAQTCLDMPVLK